MSLFPAYNLDSSKSKLNEIESNDKADTSDGTIESQPPAYGEWLKNSSFTLPTSVILPYVSSPNRVDKIPEESQTFLKFAEKPKKHHREHKKKKNKSKKADLPTELELEFTGKEEYYVDKKPALQYKTVRTLHKPACPRYRLHYYHVMGFSKWNSKQITNKQVKRYYLSKQTKEDKWQGNAIMPLDEEVYTQRTADLNRSLLQSPSELQHWVSMVHLQDRNPYKWSKLFLAEKKLEILHRALQQHHGNDVLYRLYIDIIHSTYPSFEVSKIIDKLLAKDTYNYTLWTAQILTSQCSMARCIVPNVLKIYELCMQKMHRKAHGDDSTMLKLFNKCALFLRQSGLNEQFFALLKLALELNVSPDKFNEIQPIDRDQQTLIEYEELILQSGLPMNEIWLRIEKLRQGFSFLPCPINSKCSDPQRIVFNEDICYYIYPLEKRENSFYLILLIMRLLKMPFISTDCLARKFYAQMEDKDDSDAIEDALAILLRHPTNTMDVEFNESLYDLAKEMSVSPTFQNTAIGHEIYINTLNKLLLIFADCYAGIDEQKRAIFIVIWLRLLRVLLILEKFAMKLAPEYIKELRSKVKGLLKKDMNRNVLNFYTEYALLEYEAAESLNAGCDVAVNVFKNVLTSSAGHEINSDFCYAHWVYGEILLNAGETEKALNIFVSYALHEEMDKETYHGAGKKLAAMQKLTERLDNLLSIERNVVIMELEQYFLPDYIVNLLKIKTYTQYLLGHKLEAMAYLEKALTYFVENNDRHRFLLEQIYEIYISLMQCDRTKCMVSNVLICEKIAKALTEFPRNLFLLKSCSMLYTQPWYKVRSILLHSDISILSVIFIIAAAKFRYTHIQRITEDTGLACDNEHNELTYRNRILNVLKSLMVEKGALSAVGLQRNALCWRFYLRCLSDQRTAFETSKKSLLTALDECPWNKSLYLDGATFVPQELSHLQDLIIEKQLRIYALPEELEILRTHDVAFTE